MCWACYTPLTGDAAATAAAARPGKAPPRADAHREEKEDKKAIAPWQIGVVVLALLIAGGGAFMMTRGSTSADESLLDNSSAPFPAPDRGTIRVPGPSQSSESGVMQSGTVQVPQTQTQDQPSFTMTTPPARGVAWPSVGIVPTTSVNAQQAAALALMARKQLTRGSNYQAIYVYVFRDRNAASKFQTFQRANRGAPLQGDDYTTLSDLWASTLVRYEYNRGNEDVRYPSTNTNSWWSTESHYTKARE